MKIIVIGAAGDVGRAVCAELGARHEIITVGRSSGDIRADVTDFAAVQNLFQKTSAFDALISCAGEVVFAPLTEHTPESLMTGLQQKVMGQINLVLAGLDVITEGGSFTLTSGILDRDPVRKGAGAATANGALGGFVKSAAIELPRSLRINVVSPGLLDVSAETYGEIFPGHSPVASTEVGRAYAKSVEGAITGQVIIV
ncbi:MAG: short chain dehydrogenase [Pseudomonadota bacterium]